jgi:tetratricopeptide (TPR) repeat protein
MNNNYTNSDLLVQYLDNELSPEEKSELENQLNQNTAMQQELENLTLAKQAIKNYGLKQKVGAIHVEMMKEMAAAETPAKKGMVRSIARRSMKIAASLLLVLLGFGVYQYVSVSPDKLFAEKYQPYSLSVSIGAADADAMENAYKEKNYTTVINLFTGLPAAGQKENFLAGQAYLATNDYPKSIVCFNKVLSLNTAAGATFFKDDTEYYLALSYLKNKEIKLAYPLFVSIYNNSDHLYNEKITAGMMRKLKLINWKY